MTVVIDTAISSRPWKIGHFYCLLVFSAIYCIFQVVYVVIFQGKNHVSLEYIYNISSLIEILVIYIYIYIYIYILNLPFRDVIHSCIASWIGMTHQGNVCKMMFLCELTLRNSFFCTLCVAFLKYLMCYNKHQIIVI